MMRRAMRTVRVQTGGVNREEKSMKGTTRSLLAACSIVGAMAGVLLAADPPKVGERAPDFQLQMLTGRSVRLSDLTSEGKVVLIVLRGWPGYQCPICTAQVHDYVRSAPGFAEAKARVVMVYPGPAENLKAHASEFLQDKQWPKEFIYLIDPDYTMVNAYGLRWDAPRETAYPSTFILDRGGTVRFAKVSRSHGDRTKASDILLQLKR